MAGLLRVIAVCLLLATSLSAQTTEPGPSALSPAKIEAFVERCETSRRGAILRLEHELRGLRSQSGQAGRDARRITKLEEDLRLLRAAKEPVVPTLVFPPSAGDIGRLPRLTCHVDQVLSKDEMLVRCYFPLTVATVRHFRPQGESIVQPVTFLVRGVPTQEVQEGADLELLQVFEIRSKQSYPTTDGKVRSAAVLTEFDMKTAEPYFQRLRSRP